MRTIAHISDLHFGRVNTALIEPFLATLTSLSPDVVAISGDLTQRARAQQFRDARAFLERIPFPQIVVPGNHDVPLYNIFARFLAPLRNYRRHITDDLQPVYVDDEIVIIGINTARSLTFKDGRINAEQVESIRTRLAPFPDKTAIVVTHHPFDLPEGSDEKRVGRAKMAMVAFAECGVDVLLSGHFHLSHAGETGGNDGARSHSALLVHAGTTLSTRARGESNSFNVLRVASHKIIVEQFTWNPERNEFALSETECFVQENLRWRRALSNASA